MCFKCAEIGLILIQKFFIFMQILFKEVTPCCLDVCLVVVSVV